MCLSRTELRLWETNDIIIERVFFCALRETMYVAVLTTKLLPFGTTFINSFLSFFLNLTLLPTHCVCRDALLHLFTLIDTHTHNLYDSSGREIGPSHRPLYYNTQYSQEKASTPPKGFAPAIPASEQPQTPALDRANTRVISEVLSQGTEFLSTPLICFNKSDLGIDVTSFYTNTRWEIVMEWTEWLLIRPSNGCCKMIRTFRFHKSQ